jgi:hypothetical protein
MKSLNDFLNYIWDNIDDPRIQIVKKLKYGYRYYHIYINLPTINGPTVGIHVDSRNNVVELSYEYGESVVIESEDLSNFWIERIESKYNERIESSLKNIVDSFIENTDTKGKDFWRDWTMNKIFDDKKDLD